MLMRMSFAAGLVVITVVVHALGLDVLLRTLFRSKALARTGFRPVTGMVIGLACWLVLVHALEIVVWGLFYFWRGCLPDVESAIYFSGVTYTTLGYGDVVLPREWRMLAPVEALTAILMCGLSTGLFFALVTVWVRNWMQKRTASDPHASIRTSD